MNLIPIYVLLTLTDCPIKIKVYGSSSLDNEEINKGEGNLLSKIYI